MNDIVPTWIIHWDIIEGKPSEILPEIVLEEGGAVEIIRTPEDRRFDDLVKTSSYAYQPVILYGSIQMVRSLAIVEGQSYMPGAYGTNRNNQLTQYLSHTPGEWYLNENGVYTTWADFKARRDFWYDLYGNLEGYLFVRPDSGNKTFTGTTIGYGEHKHICSAMDQTTGVIDSTLIRVSAVRQINAEYRFFIVQNQVVAGTEYHWGTQVASGPIPQSASDLAQKVAEYKWQMDAAYSCDIAMTPDGPKVIELNSFACAGFYDADVRAIVKAVNKAAMEDFED